MAKIKYIVSGITEGRLRSVLDQAMKSENDNGVFVIGTDTVPEVIEIDEDGKPIRIPFAEFIHKTVNQPQDNKG